MTLLLPFLQPAYQVEMQGQLFQPAWSLKKLNLECSKETLDYDMENVIKWLGAELDFPKKLWT